MNTNSTFIHVWASQVFFQLLTHIFKTLPLFSQTLHTNPRIAHTKCKMSHITCKMKHCIQNITNTSQSKHLSYVANTFAVILYHIDTVIQNLKLFFHELICTFLHKIESNWQRDVEKITVNMKARLKPNSFFYCKHLWLWLQYYTVRKKGNTSTVCSCVDVYL